MNGDYHDCGSEAGKRLFPNLPAMRVHRQVCLIINLDKSVNRFSSICGSDMDFVNRYCHLMHAFKSGGDDNSNIADSEENELMDSN